MGLVPCSALCLRNHRPKLGGDEPGISATINAMVEDHHVCCALPSRYCASQAIRRMCHG
jgi:hypothetical protein